MHAFERARYLAHQRLHKMMSGGSAEHTPERTVVIIDMQDYFIGKRSYRSEPASEFVPLVDGVCELVFWAKSNNWGIILVEFSDLGQTTQRILDAIGAYQHVDTVIKYTEDGGAEVCQCLKNHPCWSLNLLVCGVFGDACVPATVRSLFEHNSLVEVDVITELVVPEYESDYQDEGPPERSISLASLGLQKSCVA